MRFVLHKVASFLNFHPPVITSSKDHNHLSSQAVTTRHWMSEETCFSLLQQPKLRADAI
jgi:hypothetical protein